MVVKVMELMPALCDHLESVATYFQVHLHTTTV